MLSGPTPTKEMIAYRKTLTNCDRCDSLYTKTLETCPHCSSLTDVELNKILKIKIKSRASLGRKMLAASLLILIIMIITNIN